MRWVPHRGQGMEDYRLLGSRVNPKNCARVMSSFQKIRGRVQGIFVFGNLSLDVENTGALLAWSRRPHRALNDQCDRGPTRLGLLEEVLPCVWGKKSRWAAFNNKRTRIYNSGLRRHDAMHDMHRYGVAWFSSGRRWSDVAHLHGSRQPPGGKGADSASSASFHVTLQKPRGIPYEVFWSCL